MVYRRQQESKLELGSIGRCLRDMRIVLTFRSMLTFLRLIRADGHSVRRDDSNQLQLCMGGMHAAA